MAGVEVKLGGTWVPLKRSANNQWPYYTTNGPWQSSFPMPIRLTSAAGETLEDAIPSAKGGDGTKQFAAVRLAHTCCTLPGLRALTVGAEMQRKLAACRHACIIGGNGNCTLRDCCQNC